jgi:hypothetical protein
MGDYYGATLTISGFPSYAVALKEVKGYGDSRWEEAEIDFEAAEAKLADDLREGFADEESVLNWQVLRRELSRIGEPEQMSWTPDAGGETGILEMDWSQLSYGTYQLQGQVLPTLQILGLPFFACDDGKYENAGASHEWRPGWERIASGAYHSSTGKLLSRSDWKQILNETDSPEDAAKAVTEFLGSD